jgi:SHS2 domain-containing protein
MPRIIEHSEFKMGSYEFLPHTADEKFVVTANSLDDGFSTSVEAFFEILLGKSDFVHNKVTKKIILKAKKISSLLYDFLNELVFYFDSEDLLLQIVNNLVIEKDDENHFILTASLSGDYQYDYSLRTEIKNMTYNEMEILESENGVWSLTVVVDI